MRILSTCLLATSLATATIAQDQPNTILVMDGSGSMWGQIDGTAKITIAQQVVSSLLEEFPANQGLGLTVYGHRERGNCTDIETIVAPAPGTVGDIVTAVNGITPLGKTPMTDAIIAAAEALRYTEDSATVILISDGVETCNPDPCAAARLLEETGINFTAHVVGFDVDDPEALAQMQCIADETGGQFLTAANAAELDLAMTAMVMEPDPIMVTGTFEARIGDANGSLVEDSILWEITGSAGDIADDAQGNPLTFDLSEADYTATAYRIVDEAEQTADFTVSGAGDIAITVIFPEPTPTATVVAPDTAVAGSVVFVEWTGPNGEGDQIITAEPDGNRTLTYTNTAEGSPLELRLPPTEGTYDIRYRMREGLNNYLATTPIVVTPAEATLSAPDQGAIGETIAVDWTGPDYDGDMIVIGAPDGPRVIEVARTNQGNPADIKLPTTPGIYDIHYRMQQGATVIATRQIEVTDLLASLDAPDSAFAGETIAVTWDGPDYDNDFIAVGAPGENAYINYTYTSEGSPAQLQMPPEPGDYEIRYTLRQDSETIATRKISVTAPEVRLTAPDSAVAGSDVTVEWVGPDYDNDFITVATPRDRSYINYTYTSEGSPLTLQMPPEPGDYEIRYTLRQDNTVLATQKISVTEPEVGLIAPDTAVAGSDIPVEWTGPDYENDFIAVSIPGERSYINYTYTSDGNPLILQMPPEPGDYEIRYTLRQDNEVIATRKITVTEPQVGLTAPDTAAAGSRVAVDWVGPDYDGDFIAIGEVGSRNYENYTYTNEGTPLALEMPTEPGTYEIRYTLRQDSEVIFSHPIEITTVKATIDVPATANAGETLTLTWQGPDYDRDYVSVGAVGSNQYDNYTYTSEGSPISLLMPPTPGDYEIRYQLRQDSAIIFRQQISIAPVKAQLVAPDTIAIGEDLVVGWDGPDYDGDFIGISKPGESGYERYIYTRDGNPVSLRLPDTPGNYELRYFIGQDSTVIATRPITIAE